MSGLLTSLQGAASALNAFSQALSADQANVSNASTPGYAAVRAVINPVGFFGAGSGADSVVLQSTGSAQADAIVQAASSQASYSQTQAQQLGSVSQQFDITGSTGILAAFQQFSSAFATLAVSPDDPSAAQSALSAASGVAAAFNSVAQSLGNQSQSLQTSAQSTVTQINNLAGQIAQYNVAVRGQTELDPGTNASQRQALTQLSSLVGITVTQNSDGTVNVLAGGTVPLVLGDQPYTLTANLAAAPGSQITSSGGGSAPPSFSGTLGSLVDTLNNTITPILGGDGQPGSLNTLAQGFASTVNSLLTSGVTSAGAAGVPIFIYNPASAAATLAVDPSVTTDQIAVATTGASASSNGVANQLAALTGSASSADQIGGVSPQDYYSSIAQSVGQQLSDATSQSASDQTSLTSAQASQTSIEGVSLDQEAINITADQRSWEAAAKLVTVLDTLTLDSVNLVGEQDLKARRSDPMTVNSATIGADWFLNGLANLQNQELQTQRQLSSGYAVSTAADDPAATRDLVDLGSSLATGQTYQSNLGSVQAEASAADNAIGSAITLIQSAQSLGTQGASSTTTAAQQQNLAVQIQSIQQQIVGLANTQIAGRYIFGGDQDQSPPYQYDASSTTGADALTASQSTRQVLNPAGDSVYQSLTAGTIFDPSSGGSPSATNAFAALQNLETALQTNNTAGVATAVSSLQGVSAWLNQQQVYYGTSEQRLTSEQNTVSSQITAIQTGISGIRDANVAQDATDLTQESTDQQAALAAQAEVPQKSLFDYLA